MNFFSFGSLAMGFVGFPKMHITISSQTFSFPFQNGLPMETNIGKPKMMSSWVTK
jgi:hypothetical protein